MIRIFFSLMMLVALSCNDVESLDVDVDSGVSSESPLKINASTEITTKGELVYEVEDMGSVGLYCALTGDEKWSTSTTFSKMENRRFFVTDDGDWQIDGDSESWGYTSLEDKYTFFGYSPFCDDTQGVTAYIEDGELVIDYVTPSSSIDQPDLMYALPRKDIYAQIESGVTLNFYHALSSVSFGLITTTDKKITAIKISGIVDQGSLSWDYDLNQPTWSLGDPTTNSFDVEVGSYTPNDTTSTQVNSERGYLMMIPQELTNGAYVTVTLNNGEQKTLMIPAGTVWEAGSYYSYIIRLDDETGEFIFDSTQISNCYIINPTVGEETVVQIPIEDRINDFWKNYSEYGRKKIKNASTTYEFTVAMVWEDFDGDFTFKYVVVDDADSKMAVLLTIPATFQEGNFVFAVQEDDGNGLDTTLWSWHLWLTDYNPDAIAAANKDCIEEGVDREYKLDGYEGAVHRYKDADKKVTVWSDIYKDKFIMDRNIGERNKYSSDYGAGAVYYQFGRKDPFPGNGAWYGGTKTQPSVRSSSGYDFYESVEYSSDLLFSSSSSSNNWSGETAARNTKYIWFDENLPIEDYSEGKSIFDPSPLGWRVPVSDTWSSFDSTGSTQDCSSDTKSVGVYNYYGYRNPDNKGVLSQGGEVGYVWSANPTDAQTGLGLYYSYSSVISPYSLYMTSGLPVRAIQE
ncbi:MAG: fimbrillin family protein [Rikenellaceae bacterium]